ncbi:hypothetical protein [Silanimonas sp.]|uniref:hypothetical protein n=1 Tax=Silanimonas sp. TaxID=1929290 RepID=UPI0022C6F7C5|nr:hypothetical protein [Silanimonas sp.]MCZ8164571.1 hypothetical protein [Silanimonas sp.]
MTLAEYLDATEYAARSLLDAIWHEQAEVETLSARVATLERRVQAEYATALAIIDGAETPDDVMLGVGRDFENYFGSDREWHGQRQELEVLRAAREARASALGALAGNLLQVAKQGLSMAFGEEANWPDGREVHSQTLKAVIRSARNQTLHWEEGQCRPATVQVFEGLAQDCGAPFADYNTSNLAMLVIALLGWRTYDNYVADMRRFS